MSRDVSNSALCRTHEANAARNRGYRVFHDINGWYVVEPNEHAVDGYSFGFDGREHFDYCHQAWREANRTPLQRLMRKAASQRV